MSDVVYAIFADGTLKWYEHKGFNTGVGFERADSWGPPKNVGRGWDGFVDVFSGERASFMGSNRMARSSGTDTWDTRRVWDSRTPGSWANPRTVGRGWSGYKHVFAGGQGVIYVIADDGTLKWYRHKAYLTGSGLETPGSWEGPKDVGRGWGDVEQVFSPGDGIIYAVMPDGTLRWFKHVGYLDGRGLESPRRVARTKGSRSRLDLIEQDICFTSAVEARRR